jgi:RHS repeat-associated protein
MDGRAIAEIDDQGVHELHSDHLRTPRVITDGATGAIQGIRTYGPYGEGIGERGYQPLTGYTGHVQTEPNGLIYMRGRFYSPAWHCFLSSDRGMDPLQMNQYAYAGGNPFMAADPAGMWHLHSGAWNRGWGKVGEALKWNQNRGYFVVAALVVAGLVTRQYYSDQPGGDQVPNGLNPARPLAPVSPVSGVQRHSAVDAGPLERVGIGSDCGPIPLNSDDTIYGLNDPVYMARSGGQVDQSNKTWSQYFNDRMAAPGELARSYGISNGVIDEAGNLSIYGSVKGGWGIYKFGRAFGAGSNASSLSTFVDFGGTTGAFNFINQIEQASTPIAMGWLAVQTGYAVGSAAGALGDVLADHL